MFDEKTKHTPEKGWAVDKGQEREQNEDSIAAVDMSVIEGDSEKSIGIYAVADGMGGEQHGEVASSLAVNTVVNQIMEHLTRTDVSVEENYQVWLEEAVRAANKAVYRKHDPMGTTLVTTIVIGHNAYIANVGDSRAYIITASGIQQVTEDQSLVQVLLKAGAINTDQAAKHPYKNILSQAIGQEKEVEPDLYTANIEDGGYLLLCSDGLTNEVDEETIYNIVTRSATPQAACDDLVEAANQHGGQDNISVLIVKLGTNTQKQ